MDIPTRTLNSGGEIPVVGFGVFLVPRGRATQDAVGEALRAGYRHIDTARAYGNEKDVGIAVRSSGLARSEVFVTTKLWNDDQGYDEALRAFDASCGRLDLEYVDLYLIHWPSSARRKEAWRALERIYEEGRAKAIGVSNYMVHHLEELFGHANVTPAVNQIEVSPFLQQRDVRALCHRHGILVQAYSPLTKGERLGHEAVVAIAERIGRSPAQVLLRWGLQHDLVVLPKSVHPERIRENLALFDFDLDASAMGELDGLEEGLVTGWDPREMP
jgi:methylglyoxal/glyoxal reductase